MQNVYVTLIKWLMAWAKKNKQEREEKIKAHDHTTSYSSAKASLYKRRFALA